MARIHHDTHEATQMKKLFIGFLLFIAIMLTGCITTTRDGTHTGQVTAIEENGLIWPTYDAYVKTDATSSQEDVYCVENKELIPILRNLSESRTKITVHYHSELFVAPWRCTGSDIIDSIST
jgi:hypothetical protein